MENTSSSSSGPPRLDGEHSQYAMLDMFIPGFSLLSTALQTYLGVDLTLYIPVLLIIAGLAWAWSYISSYFGTLVEGYLMSSVRVRTDDEIFNMVMAWVAQQRFSQNSRRFIVNTNTNSRAWTMWQFFDNADDDDEENDENEDDYYFNRKKKTKRELQYTPYYGSHLFWYKGWPLFFDRLDKGGSLPSEHEELQISCFGPNPDILKDLLLEARTLYHEKDECKTMIYRGAPGTGLFDPTWKRCMARSSRPFSTVILDEKTKENLINDMADYMHPATCRWYANRGIPYRRGYLLHGPPGTGKSSLSLALAGYFKMRIYILSLSSPLATEENVSALFNSLPRKCVVLLEDIDTAGLTHSREKENNSDSSKSGSKEDDAPKAPPVPGPDRLSLSGLLNILDGVASQEGRVLIMTTNHIEKLDKALIRPGRVDMTVHFGRADKAVSGSIFRSIYSPHEGEEIPMYHGNHTATDPEKEESEEKREEKRLEAVMRIKELAQKFADKIPEHEFSPAEIQGLLLRHKTNPMAAIDGCAEWIVQTRKEREDKDIKEAEELRKKKEEEKKEKEKDEEKDSGQSEKATLFGIHTNLTSLWL